MPGPDQVSERAAGSGAIRLLFEYSGEQISLVGQHRVDVAVPGVDIHSELRPGHFVEVRTADGSPLARVTIREDMSGSAEVFPEDHSEPISRIQKEAVQGAFTVVVPAPLAAQSVAVIRVSAPDSAFAPPPAGGTSPVPGEPVATDLASFPLEPEL
jgi:hypothetical protein